jgi:hypothetical protein
VSDSHNSASSFVTDWLGFFWLRSSTRSADADQQFRLDLDEIAEKLRVLKG